MSEKDFAELIKFLFQVPGAIAVMFLAVKWVVSDWFKKNSEIEKLKSQLSNKETESLKDRVKELEVLIKEYTARTVIHSNQIEVAQKSMNEIVIKVDDFSSKTSHALNEYARLTHERLLFIENFNNQLRDRLKANAEKSEKVPVGKDSVMIRTKKDE